MDSFSFTITGQESIIERLIKEEKLRVEIRETERFVNLHYTKHHDFTFCFRSINDDGKPFAVMYPLIFKHDGENWKQSLKRFLDYVDHDCDETKYGVTKCDF